jgi:hypothetical protein
LDVRLTNVYVADAKLVADGLAQPEDAMAVFVGRAGKGRVAPFVVQRSYTGAGGWYREAMALLAPNGDLVWRSGEQAITLRGSSKIDTFTDEVHGVVVDSDDDHELALLVGGDEVGRVPLAVLDEDPPYPTGSDAAVLDEALKKSTVVWIEVPGEGGTAPSTVASTSSPAGPSSTSPGSRRPTGWCWWPAPRSCSRWWPRWRPARGWCRRPTRCSRGWCRCCCPAG